MSRKLAEIVDSFTGEKGLMERDEAWFRFYRMAIDGYMELARRSANIDWFRKYIEITPNMSGVFPIPAGYKDYEFVGACHNGRMVAFEAANDMCPPKLDECGDFKKGPGAMWYNHDYQGFDIHGRSTGTKTAEAGYFKFFYDQGYIVVKAGSLPIDQILMVYKSLPEVAESGDYMVPDSFDIPIRAWIEYRDAWANTGTSSSARRRDTEREWVKYKNAARLENNPMDLFEVVKSLT